MTSPTPETAINTNDALGPEVRFRCAGKKCSEEGRTRIDYLVGEGCPACGSKVLEVWHPHRGHVKIDYRSQKTVRKRRRRRELAAFVGAIVAMFIGCTPAPFPSESTRQEQAEPATIPTVSWSFAAYDTLCGRRMLPDDAYGAEFVYPPLRLYDRAGFEVLGPETFRLYLAAVEEKPYVQIWRIEWSPVATGDTCFYPIAFPMLHHDTPAGVISVRITGAIAGTDSTPGDKILFWQSEPWPRAQVAVMDSANCMDPVYGN